MEFSKEQIEKAKNCKTIEELKVLAKNEGLNLTEEETKMYFNATRVGELNDDDLDQVAGGAKGWFMKEPFQYRVICPFCGAKFYVAVKKYRNPSNDIKFEWEPNTCGCGATIDYMDSTMNFLFIKNGEERHVKPI